MAQSKTEEKAARRSHLRWVPIGDMTINPESQRRFRKSREDELVAGFELEGMGYPVLNRKNGTYHIVDGQHRISALRRLDFGEEDKVQCEVYEDLTPEEEAEIFLERNNYLSVTAYDKFRVGVNAGREDESSVVRLTNAIGLHIPADQNNTGEGSVRCPMTLLQIYRQSGPAMLTRTLRVVSQSFGDVGLTAPAISGIHRFLTRYEGQIEEDELITKLSQKRGGFGALMTEAMKLYKSTGNPRNECFAAAIVDTLNRGRKPKLASWWRG